MTYLLRPLHTCQWILLPTLKANMSWSYHGIEKKDLVKMESAGAKLKKSKTTLGSYKSLKNYGIMTLSKKGYRES